MRSLARECVFKYIFSRLFNPGDEGLFDVLCKDLNDDDKSFASQLLCAVDNNEEAYMKKINELGSVSSACKLHRADLCALLLGMAELDNFPNTPVPVVIDEAVNIVAKYSTESSTDFVNGVLAEYAKEK